MTLTSVVVLFLIVKRTQGTGSDWFSWLYGLGTVTLNGQEMPWWWLTAMGLEIPSNL